MASTMPARFPTAFRLRYSRSKTGCLTCRQRRKKCSEDRPTCISCSRNNYPCTWPAEESADHGQAPEDGTAHRDSVHVRIEPEDRNKTSIAGCAGEVSLPIWPDTLGTFINGNRRGMLTSHSGQIFQHYIGGTGRVGSSSPASRNPYMTIILPLAHVDDLLFHCVLAVGGAHLSSRQPANTELHHATMHHYSYVLRSLRAAMLGLQHCNANQTLRVLLALVLTGSYESLASTCLRGAIFHHLEAMRRALESSPDDNRQQFESPENRCMYGFILETYAYLAIVNTITPHQLLPARAVPYDDMLTCLDSLRNYHCFGILFCGYHGLFELIPTITQLSNTGEDRSRLDMTRYHSLRTRIQGWWFPGSRYPEHVNMAQRLAVGEVYRHALFIFLETATLGSSVPTAEFKLGIQEHVGAVMSSITSNDVLESELASILLWPTIITGSVLVDESHRKTFAAGLRGSPYGTWSTIRAAELLEFLWEESNSGFYGPYGLYQIMRKRGISLCMS